MKSRSGLARAARAALVPLALALALAAGAPGDTRAKWRGIAAADSQIVFAGRQLDAYRSAHHYFPFVDSAYKWEGYQARWTAPSRRVPVFWARLRLLAPNYHFIDGTQRNLDARARNLPWFRVKPFSAGEESTARTLLGQFRYLIFTSGDDRCAAFRLFVDDGTYASPNSAGSAVLSGVYCPVSDGLDKAAVESVLSRIGIRDMAVPEADTREAARPDAPPDIARLVREGDMWGLRRAAAAGGFDPNHVIAVSHPRIGGGREIERPLLAAAALFGHTEMVAFLLDKGASTGGRAAWAICGAVVTNRRDIVDLILEKDPAAAYYGSCGRGGDLTPRALARRLGRADIAGRLLAAGG